MAEGGPGGRPQPVAAAQAGAEEQVSGDTGDEWEAELAQLSCASLVDAMGRLHSHRAHLLPLVSPDPGRPLFGPAVTIAYLPTRDDLAPSAPGLDRKRTRLNSSH